MGKKSKQDLYSILMNFWNVMTSSFCRSFSGIINATIIDSTVVVIPIKGILRCDRLQTLPVWTQLPSKTHLSAITAPPYNVFTSVLMPMHNFVIWRIVGNILTNCPKLIKTIHNIKFRITVFPGDIYNWVKSQKSKVKISSLAPPTVA